MEGECWNVRCHNLPSSYIVSNKTKLLTIKRILLVLSLAAGGANAQAQIGWRLPRVQQYFGQSGERQRFDPSRAQGIFRGRILNFGQSVRKNLVLEFPMFRYVPCC